MSLLLRFFGWTMRKRLAAWEAGLRDPRTAQEQRLRAMLAANAETAFGREHGFASITSWDDYRRAVPIRPPEAFAPLIDRIAEGEANVLTREPVEMFATTSGTASTPKLCPVTHSFTQEHHGVHKIWMYHLACDHPAIAGGRYLTMLSPAEERRTPGGIPVGAMSGRQYENQAWPIRRRHAVPYEVYSIADYPTRYHVLLTYALAGDLTVVTSVNPSTLVHLARYMRDHAETLLDDLASGQPAHAAVLTPKDRAAIARTLRPQPRRAAELRERLRADGALLPRNAWPGLACMVTWQGGSAPFYLAQLDDLWGSQPRRCLGLRASEGTFSIPLADGTPSGALAITGHGMEFLPSLDDPAPDAETLLAHELEPGQRYRLVLTTSGGLYRYDIGDVVEVTGRRAQTPEIAFLHKAGNVLSVTGEKVTEAQVVAVLAAIEKQHPHLCGFTLSQEWIQPPRMVLAIEWSENHTLEDTTARIILQEFEDRLRDANEEYATKRDSGRLAPPRLLILDPGSYAAHRAALVAAGRPDGQIKPPHLIRPPGPGAAPVPGCRFFDQVQVARGLELPTP